MVELPAIASALAALKAAKDIAQAMVGLRDSQAFQAKVIEFQSRILDAQAATSAANEERSMLIERIGALEEEVAKAQAWDAQAKRYELVELHRSNFAYAMKKERRSAEPMHYLCASCYQKRQKSILQGYTRLGMHHLVCPLCKLEVIHSVDPNWSPSV